MEERESIERVAGWAVLRTAARWEKAVAEKLGSVGITTYLPLMTRLSVTSSKRRTAQVPLFPGYVFCAEGEYLGSKLVPVDCRKLIAQFLRSPDPTRLKNELLSIADLLTNRQLVQERVYGAVGDTVRIVGGPLTGHTGRILQLKPGTYRVVLEVSFLGVRVEATVDEQYLQRVGTGGP